MALAVDASSPIRFTGTPAGGGTITSASFTPPAGSIIVVTVQSDTDDAGTGTTFAYSDSVDGTTGWGERIKRDDADDSNGGAVSIGTKVVGASVAMTVTVTRSGSDGSTNRVSAKAYVVTGQNSSDPLGAVGEASVTTNNTTPTILTTEQDNSLIFVSVSDWNQLGSPASSDGIEDSADYSGAISVMSMYEAQTTAGAKTMNIDFGGTGSAAGKWVGLEIIEEAGGAAAVYYRHLLTLGVGA